MLTFGAVMERLRMCVLLSRDQYYAVRRVIAWVQSIAEPSTVIRIEFPWYTATLRFAFPLRARDLPRRARNNVGPPTFIIRPPASLRDEQWTRVFRSPDIEVLERTKTGNLLPLRFGLSDDEYDLALTYARETIRDVVEKRPMSQRWNVPPRFMLPSDVNVALWVAGELRGSRFVEGKNFKDGLVEAARHVSQDPRFKPISGDDVAEARVQITLMHSLNVPISNNILKRDRILFDKGYVLRRKQHSGRFLPEVLNVRKFPSQRAFLSALSEEKAGLAADAYKDAEVSVFEVADCIESHDRTRAIRLYGSMVEPRTVSLEESHMRFRAAADWLRARQEPSGNIPPGIDVFTGKSRHIDWPRLAFTAWALAEYGGSVQNDAYRAAAEKTYFFLDTYIFDREMPHRDLSLVYFARLALALGYSARAYAAASFVHSRVSRLEFEPILFSQLAGLFRVLASSEMVAAAQTLEQVLKEKFELARKNKTANLAAWAELATLFERTDPAFSKHVCEWFVAQQTERGAFPEAMDSDFMYTRGTGKIFEVLAQNKRTNATAIEKTLAWLFSMQYNEENMFFVPPALRPLVIGGFRHDYVNSDAWIDAAGHMLLGAARLQETT